MTIQQRGHLNAAIPEFKVRNREPVQILSVDLAIKTRQGCH